MRGKAIYNSKMVTRLGDHPRICGEKIAGIGDTVKQVGSPPHMRGKAFECAV